MTLSPADVEQKTFSTALRGYDLDEVDDFLDEVVATIRDLNEQIASGDTAAPSPAEKTPAPEPAPPADESAVGRALIAAQETADRIVSEAREEAERIIAEARSEADTLIGEKEQQRAEAEAEMAKLAEHVAGVRSQLALLATTVADGLDEMDAVISSRPESSTGTDDHDDEGEDPEDVVVDAVEEFTLEDSDEKEPGDEEDDDQTDGPDETNWS